MSWLAKLKQKLSPTPRRSMEVELLERQRRRRLTQEEREYEQRRNWSRRRHQPVANADGQITYHGACHGCSQHLIHGNTAICHGCQYHNANWSLPNLNNKNDTRFDELIRKAPPITQADIDRVSGKHFDEDLFTL